MSSSSSSPSTRSSATAYSRVDEQFLADSKSLDNYDNESDHGVPMPPTRSRVTYVRTVLPWIFATVFFLVTTLLLTFGMLTGRAYRTTSDFGDFNGGFYTDMDAAKPYIRAHKVKFTGSVEFHENGTMYRSYPPDQPHYVGTPSPEIDKAWNDLLYGSGVDLTREEMGPFADVTWEEPQGGLYRSGLEVFHQLHCLDYIRKAIYPDYYPPEDIAPFYMMHVEHCIDYVRQALMCLADSTPVRLEWRRESHYLIPKFDQPHTCRNFELVKQFSREHALEIHNVENQRRIDDLVKQGVL